MIANLFYIAGILNALYGIMIVAFFLSILIYGVSFLHQYTMASNEEEKGNAKKLRRMFTPLLIGSIIWMVLVPDGDTFLKVKAAKTVGDERVIELLEVMDNKLIEELQDTVDYD